MMTPSYIHEVEESHNLDNNHRSSTSTKDSCRLVRFVYGVHNKFIAHTNRVSYHWHTLLTKTAGKIMRTLQFVGVGIVAAVLTIKTIHAIMKDMKDRAENGYGTRRNTNL